MRGCTSSVINIEFQKKSDLGPNPSVHEGKVARFPSGTFRAKTLEICVKRAAGRWRLRQGEVEYEEACLSDGKFTADHECTAIDWCPAGGPGGPP